MKSDKLYIDQMLDSIRKIELYVKEFDKNKFLTDSKTQSAVILQLTLIGEISKKISERTKLKIDLPWKKIAGFRDRAIHNYFDINLDVVWNTIIMDIPILKSKLQKSF
mgnify:FL=1